LRMDRMWAAFHCRCWGRSLFLFATVSWVFLKSMSSPETIPIERLLTPRLPRGVECGRSESLPRPAMAKGDFCTLLLLDLGGLGKWRWVYQIELSWF
jgi:hypothetical protein